MHDMFSVIVCRRLLLLLLLPYISLTALARCKCSPHAAAAAAGTVDDLLNCLVLHDCLSNALIDFQSLLLLPLLLLLLPLLLLLLLLLQALLTIWLTAWPCTTASACCAHCWPTPAF
jgi:hypothetical protein